MYILALLTFVGFGIWFICIQEMKGKADLLRHETYKMTGDSQNPKANYFAGNEG